MNKKILQFATNAHEGKLRKYSNLPYISHPIEVANRVKDRGGDKNMVNASLLHDVLEDTKVTHSELRVFLHEVLSTESAEDVLKLVVELTDVYTKENFPHDNRKYRKDMEAFRLAYISKRAKQIKLIDIEHNSESILEKDPNFAKVFLKEKEFLIEKLGMIS